MSSIRNAVPTRSYRERAQPHSRQNRHGLLEKHKDYSLRAADHNAKKKRLRLLREKAADRNPDEFYFGMLSSRTKNGIKIADRGNKPLSEEVVRLLKTQDAGYLRTVLQVTRKESRVLEEKVQAAEQERGDRTVFVEDEDQADVDGLEMEDSEGSKQLDSGAKADRKTKILHLAKLKTRLRAVKEREQQLTIAEDELEKQRAQMSGTIGGVNKNGVKFKVRERKR